MRKAISTCAVLVTGAMLAAAAAGASGGCGDPADSGSRPTTRPASASAPADFKAHQVAAGDLRFSTPAAWKKADKPGSMAVMTLYIDEQKSSLRVNAMDLQPGQGLQQTVAASEAQTPKANKNFKHVGTVYFQAAGAPAARVTFDVSARGQNLKVMQVLLARGRKMYGLTFTAAADRFATLAPTFEQVIASAEFQ